MPPIEGLEAALRMLGWIPLASDHSVQSRAWFHPEILGSILRTPRTDWVRASVAARILRRARNRNPYR